MLDQFHLVLECLQAVARQGADAVSVRLGPPSGLLQAQLDGVLLNGPPLDDSGLRLAGNLNVQFQYVDGESLMLGTGGRVALSAGSACTAAEPAPSHVLKSLGLTDDAVRSSLRFGLGRFTTAAEIEQTIEILVEGVGRLRSMSSMADQ